jgi:hypothetical protein
LKPHIAYPILTIVLMLILSGLYPTHAGAVVGFMAGLSKVAGGELSNDESLRQAFWAIGGLVLLLAGTGAAVNNWGR